MPEYFIPTATLHERTVLCHNGKRIPCRVENDPQWFREGGFHYLLRADDGTTYSFFQPRTPRE